MWAVSTYTIAVSIFDCILNVPMSNDGIWKWNVVSETATPDDKETEKHSENHYGRQ